MRQGVNDSPHGSNWRPRLGEGRSAERCCQNHGDSERASGEGHVTILRQTLGAASFKTDSGGPGPIPRTPVQTALSVQPRIQAVSGTVKASKTAPLANRTPTSIASSGLAV